MISLALRVISRTTPNFLPQYECKRGIKFLKNLFKKQLIRVPIGYNVEDYKVFYRFPQVSAIAGQVKLKYFKCGIILTSASLLTYFYFNEKLDIAPLTVYVSLAFTYLLYMFYFAHIGKNIIGKMYLHKNMKEMVISYGNKNGWRINKSYGINDIKVVDHPNILYKKFFKKVIASKSGQEFNLCTYKTVKVDPIIFETIFPNVI